jgi:hypothetical protein
VAPEYVAARLSTSLSISVGGRMEQMKAAVGANRGVRDAAPVDRLRTYSAGRQ